MWHSLDNGELGYGLGGFGRKNIHNNNIWRLLLSLKWMNVYLGCCCCLHLEPHNRWKGPWNSRLYIGMFIIHLRMDFGTFLQYPIKLGECRRNKSDRAWFLKKNLVYLQYLKRGPKRQTRFLNFLESFIRFLWKFFF